MLPASRRPRHHEAALSRAEIMRCTRRCLDVLGYDGTTIRRLAAELDCAVGSIYRFFPDKRAMLSAVAQECLEPVLAAQEEGASVEATVTLYHRLATEARQLYQLMFWLAAMETEVVQTAAVPLVQAAPLGRPAVVERIVQGWAGALGSGETAWRVWIVVHGNVSAGGDVAALLACLRTMLAPTGVGQTAAPAPTVAPVGDLPVPAIHVLPVATLGKMTRQPVLVAVDPTSDTARINQAMQGA